MIKEIEKIIIDILSHELDLPLTYGLNDEGNEVPVFVIGFSNAMLGTTDKVQISVQTTNVQPVANSSKLDISVTPPIERQYFSSLQTMQVDVMSANIEARTKSHEVILALESIYSQQQQEKYQFKINKNITGFNNVSEVEGESNLNRFALTFTAFTWKYKSKIIPDYYDKFNIRADDEKTINEIDGILEFDYDFGEEP